MSRRFLVALLLALAAATAGIVAVTSPASAQTDEQILPPIVSQTPFVERGSRFVLVLDTTDVPADTTAEIVVRDRVRSRSEFTLSLTGVGLRSTRLSIGPRPVTEIPGFDRDETIFDVTVGAGDEQADLTREGVYPVEVRLTDADGTHIGGTMTHLVLLPEPSDDPKPLAVALISEIGLEPSLAPDGALRTPGNDYAAIARIVEVLAVHSEVPLSISARPETVDALAGSEDANANTALVALREAVPGRQVIAEPYVDLDVAAMLDRGLDVELDRHFDRGEAVLESVLDIQSVPGTWLARSTLDTKAVQALQKRGRDFFVVDEGDVEPVTPTSGFSLTRTFDVAVPGRSPSFAKADPVLSLRFADATDPVRSAHTVLAELAVISLEEPASSRGVVIRPIDHNLPPVETLDVFLESLTPANDLLAPVTLDQFFDQVDALDRADVDLDPAPPPDLRAYARALRDTRKLVESYETMTGELSSNTVPLERLLITAAAGGLTTAERLGYIETARETVEAALSAVSISDERTITLTARAGSVPLTLRNDSAGPLNVVVGLESERLEFPNGNTVELTLTQEITRVDIAVRTRTSGSFPVQVQVTSPDKAIELATTQLTIRSTAVSGVGIFLSIAAIIVLGIWWARDWHSGRRDRRLVDPDDESLTMT